MPGPVPMPAGRLLSDEDERCCTDPQPRMGEGAALACPPPGEGEGVAGGEAQILDQPASVSGSGELLLDYLLNLRYAGKRQRVTAARATYSVGGMIVGADITDPGGTIHVDVQATLNWNASGISLLNAHIGEFLPVTAVCQVSGMGPVNILDFTVTRVVEDD